MTATPVLVVLPTLARGGAERHAVELACALADRGWRPTALALADGPLRTELADRGVPVLVRDLPGGPRSVPAAASAVRDAVASTGAQLVSGHGVLVELATRAALRGTGVRSICWKHTYGHVGHRGARERLVERLTGGGVTAYGAVCHTQVRYLTDELGLPADRIRVVANAVEVPAAPAPLPTGDPVVLVAAAMRRDKDHDLLLRAWPAVLAAHPAARLRLAGDGPCRAELEDLVRRLDLGPSVEFLGVRADVPDLLAASSVVALASYAVECFPYAVLEAMAAGRGVVSTDVGGLPELVDDGVTGRLVPPHDVRAMSGALVEALDDAVSPAPAWGAAGRARARDVFPADRWGDRVHTLLTDLLGSTDPVPTPWRTAR